jgi:molybdenum cofactor synthesis domain-containing protein
MPHDDHAPHHSAEGAALRALVVTVSDRSAAGTRADRSGPVAVAALRAAGWDCPDAVIVADGEDSVEGVLRGALQGAPDAPTNTPRLIVTTGGTGVAPRDRTPEGTARVIDRPLPGIPEELRRQGMSDTPMSAVSRGIAGIAPSPEGGSLIINLPGSPRAVASALPFIISVAPHIIGQLAGSDH